MVTIVSKQSATLGSIEEGNLNSNDKQRAPSSSFVKSVLSHHNNNTNNNNTNDNNSNLILCDKNNRNINTNDINGYNIIYTTNINI